jgi:pimeloyl-ACP methyl ester carboxylesterase
VPATVVCVHGAWHGAWSFDRVLPLVRERGIDGVAIDLPGHGDDPGPYADLHGDAARVTEVLDTIDGDVVLVGHSYGGAVITESGVHPRVAHLVYLCAFAIDGDEAVSRAGVNDPDIATVSHEGRPSFVQHLHVADDGLGTWDAEGAGPCFYSDCDADTVAWAVARIDAHPMGNLAQAPDAVAWRDTPSTYAVCTEDMTVHPDLQRILARRCTTSVEWSTGHSPFLSRPDLVADLLVGLARD